LTNFLSVKDAGNIDELVRSAIDFRKDPFTQQSLGKGKRMGLIFLNPSLRTRLSTQIAAQNLGMETIVFNASQDGWSLEFEEGAIMNGTSVEHIKDAAPILGRYFDVLGVRTFPSLKNRDEDYNEHVMNQFVKYSGIPVVSLESATVHPLQSLTDIITIEDHLPLKNKVKPKVVLTWAPHVKPLPQCVANSFCEWMTTWNTCDFTVAHPAGYELDTNFIRDAAVTNDQAQALEDADFLYVKNWSCYRDYGKVESNDANWMLTNEKLLQTNNAKVMHCLPVRRNVELSDEVLDSSNSIVTEQAANRVWAAQAVLAKILKDLP
jgi:N-succinyl-L-ornithine transcarbamylase